MALRTAMTIVCMCTGAQQLFAQAPKSSWAPETLEYKVLWPSGVALGDATIKSRMQGDIVYLTATLEAVLPQYRLQYTFESDTTPELCSRRFRQVLRKGARSSTEETMFDAGTGKATITRDGKASELPAGRCVRDPLAYFFHFRAQAARGKQPATDTLFLAGGVPLRMEALAHEKIKVKGSEREGDRFLITYPGVAGDGFVELWLDRGSRPAPLRVRVPLPLATFTADLQ